MKLLLPKAQSEQSRWASVLKPLTIEFEFVDPWVIHRLPETANTKNHWLNLDQFSGVICVSPVAAQVLVDALDQYWPMNPAEVMWLCNGPRTASVLEQAGLKAIYPDSGFRSEDVTNLAEFNSRSGDQWLIVKGNGGRLIYSDALSKMGARVSDAIVYDRQIDPDIVRSMELLAAQSEVVWLSSQFLLDALIAQSPIFWQQWPGTWWVSSERIANCLREQKIENVVSADGATPEALVFLIEQKLNK